MDKPRRTSAWKKKNRPRAAPSRAKPEPYPSGDSPKPHGDPFKDELKTEKKK